MDYAGVIKLVLGTGVLCLLLFLLRWLYMKGKTIGYQEGYNVAQNKGLKQTVKSYNDIVSGTMPPGMSESRENWRMSSTPGSRMEQTNADGSGKGTQESPMRNSRGL